MSTAPSAGDPNQPYYDPTQANQVPQIPPAQLPGQAPPIHPTHATGHDLLAVWDEGAAASGQNILPPGEYTFEVVSAYADVKPDKAAALNCKYRVVGGPLNGKTFYADRFYIEPTGTQEAADVSQRFQKNLASMGVDRDTLAQHRTLEAVGALLKGRVLKAEVKNRDNRGNQYNQIAIGGFTLVSAPPAAGVQQPQQFPAVAPQQVAPQQQAMPMQEQQVMQPPPQQPQPPPQQPQPQVAPQVMQPAQPAQEQYAQPVAPAAPVDATIAPGVVINPEPNF